MNISHEEKSAHEEILRSYRRRRGEIESVAVDLFKESFCGELGATSRLRANSCIAAAASFYEALDEAYPQ